MTTATGYMVLPLLDGEEADAVQVDEGGVRRRPDDDGAGGRTHAEPPEPTGSRAVCQAGGEAVPPPGGMRRPVRPIWEERSRGMGCWGTVRS